MEQEKLQKELSELQALKMQMERKMEGQKQEHLARISALEREVKDIKADRVSAPPYHPLPTTLPTIVSVIHYYDWSKIQS